MPLFPYFAYDTPDAPKAFIIVQLFAVLLLTLVSLLRWRQNRAAVGPLRDGFNKLLAISSLIHLYVLVEFAFTLSNISLDFGNYGFIIAIGLHSIVEYLICFRMLFDYRTCVKISYYFFIFFLFSFFFCMCLPWPLYLIILSFVVLPGDILTFVVSLVMIARVYHKLRLLTDNKNFNITDSQATSRETSSGEIISKMKKVRILGIIWCFHMFSAFFVFGIFLLQEDVGFLFSVNTFHQCFYLYCLMPFAIVNEKQLEQYGFLGLMGAVNYEQGGINVSSLESGGNDVDHIERSETTGAVANQIKIGVCGKFMYFMLKYTDTPLKAFMIVMGITGIYAITAFGLAFGLETMVFSDLYTNASGYYWPGGQIP